MDPAVSSLIDRAGLDKAKVRQLIGRGLEGADDGELFLEYKQTEALAFDNGRLKQATYDTSQGFGLRAVKDEAVGYAHASDLSEGALARAAEAVRAVKSGHSGKYAEAPGRTNRKLYGDDNPLGEPAFDAKVKLLETIDAYARAKDPRVRQVTAINRRHLAGGGNPARRRRDLSRHPAAGAAERLGGGRRRRPPGIRQLRRRRPRGLSALHRDQRLARRGRRSDAPGAGQSRLGGGAGRRDGRRARRRLAGRDAARGGRPWPGRRFQSQEDIGFRRPDGPAGRGQGRHRGRRRHHAVAPRLAVDRRRRHADQPHRADRGRHPGRLHAGPAERAADEHEADRQRPAREPRPRADAAHDQHRDAGGPARSERDHRLGEERPLRRQFRRRPGRHHLGQIRVPVHRGLQDRERQGHRAGEGRHADRQRADRPAPHLDDRQRLRARSRHRHLRQERPGRAGRRRPADAAHGSHHGGRHRREHHGSRRANTIC